MERDGAGDRRRSADAALNTRLAHSGLESNWCGNTQNSAARLYMWRALACRWRPWCTTSDWAPRWPPNSKSGRNLRTVPMLLRAACSAESSPRDRRDEGWLSGRQRSRPGHCSGAAPLESTMTRCFRSHFAKTEYWLLTTSARCHRSSRVFGKTASFPV